MGIRKQKKWNRRAERETKRPGAAVWAAGLLAVLLLIFAVAGLAEKVQGETGEFPANSGQVSADERMSAGERALTESERISQADTVVKKVALTYDDGPDPVYSRQLLEVLRKEDVKAAFFLVGEKIEGQEEIVRQIQEEGHTIGNHTYSHANLKELSTEDAMAQLTDTNEAIKSCTGSYPEFFRPPFGNIRKEMDKKIPMVLVSWNIDPKDWECQDTGVIIDRILKNVKENGIILMHDGYAPTVEATKQIIPLLREKGYTFVPVEELIYP